MSWHLENTILDGVKGLACLVVFGGLGLYLAWAILATIYDGTRAKSWVRVQARVTHVEFARVTYRYEWEGRKLVGDRAGSAAFRFASELDDWDLRMEALVAEAQEKEKPITILVNPANPAEAMIDNEIRWAPLVMFVIFATAFFAGGLGGAWYFGRRVLRRIGARAATVAAT